jgi:hypothetical protein
VVNTRSTALTLTVPFRQNHCAFVCSMWSPSACVESRARRNCWNAVCVDRHVSYFHDGTHKLLFWSKSICDMNRRAFWWTHSVLCEVGKRRGSNVNIWPRLGAGCSSGSAPRRGGAASFQVIYMVFVVDRVALGQISVAVLPLSPVSIIPPMTHAISTANI